MPSDGELTSAGHTITYQLFESPPNQICHIKVTPATDIKRKFDQRIGSSVLGRTHYILNPLFRTTASVTTWPILNTQIFIVFDKKKTYSTLSDLH
jgi:hypothetical protein